MAMINGTPGDDVLNGTLAIDTIDGGAGNDTILADAGDDLVSAGGGDDSVLGGDGDDDVYGRAGQDSLYGNAGNDRLFGGAGNDLMGGGAGNDLLRGDGGNDVIAGADGDDTLVGGAGSDSLTGGTGNDNLSGGTGSDTAVGGAGRDTLLGGDGADDLQGGADGDTLHGGAGNDVLDGGDGDDLLSHAVAINGGGLDIVRGGTGVDTLRLDLTTAEWLDPGIQSQLALWLRHLSVLPRDAAGAILPFAATDRVLYLNDSTLVVAGVERLQPLVDGVAVDARAPGARELDTDARVTEDTGSGRLVDSGVWRFFDLDLADAHRVDVTPVGTGVAGSLTATLIDPATGDGQGLVTWTYEVDNSALQSLAQGQTRDEAFRITVTDSTGRLFSSEVVATATGVNDAAAISGTASATVVENGPLQAGGVLTVVDPDAGESVLRPQAAGTPGDNGYGSFQVDASGAWTYRLDNTLPAVRNLGSGQTLTDTLTVVSHDGSASVQLSITIEGTSALPRVDLGALQPEQGFTVIGTDPSGRAGLSVAAAGDFNGDGFDDFIVGAPNAAVDFYDGGEAYVVFGTDQPIRPDIDVSALAPDEGFIIKATAFSSYSAGYSVASAGDVNGDGFDDLIIGGPRGEYFGGEAYLVLGGSAPIGTVINGRQVVDVGSYGANSPRTLTVFGGQEYEAAGFSVSSAGDLNGDGFDDVAIGVPDASDGEPYGGQVVVLFGSASGIGPDNGTARPGFVLNGRVPGSDTGRSVATAGDVNGDGFDDLIVSSPGARAYDNGGGSEAYVVYGTAGTNGPGGSAGVVDPATLSPAQGFVLVADATRSGGPKVQTAGDFNGDGFDDVIVGFGAATYGGTAGQAFVVFGSANGPGTVVGGRLELDLPSLKASQGIVIENAGGAVASAGDVNGDGLDDLIIGIGVPSATEAGRAFVVYGSADSFDFDAAGRQVIDLDALGDIQGFAIDGDAIGDQAGFSVSSAGDINSDGYDDLLVGAPRGDRGGADAGQAHVIYGSATAPATLAAPGGADGGADPGADAFVSNVAFNDGGVADGWLWL